MRGDEIAQAAEATKEGAKAIQEVAKATKAGIEATEKLGGFVSRIVGEPAEVMIGILTDRLRYTRWERQQRLTRRAMDFIEGEKIKEPLRIIPPKLALPIIENASLEENDELQDLWARLITSAVNPTFDGEIRSAFVDIIKQLEVNDAHILKIIHSRHLRCLSGEESDYEEEDEIQNRYGPMYPVYQPITREVRVELPEFPTSKSFIVQRLNISDTAYKESVDNLIRVRCITPFIDVKNVEIPRKVQGPASPFRSTQLFPGRSQLSTDVEQVTVTHGYDAVCLTNLGLAFANACLGDAA